MADYFGVLTSYAAENRLAIIDPPSLSSGSPPKQYTFAELLSRTTVLRERLIETGVALDGARIGLMVPGGVDFVASVLAVWSVRAMIVPICLTYPLKEISYTVTDSDQAIFIYHRDFKSTIESLLKDRKSLDVTKIPSDARPKRNLDFATLEWPLDTPANIVYTSGTTGPPKGAVHTAGSSQFSMRALLKAWELSPRDRVLHVLPLHHGHGFTLSLFLPLYAGATIEFMPKFDAAQAWSRLMNALNPRITVMMAVPTIWVKMIQYFDQNLKTDKTRAERARKAAGSLRLAISGSAALPLSIRSAWAEIANGYQLLERYGTSETGITFTGYLTPNGRIQGSVGWPVPGVQARIIAEDGRDVSNIAEVMGEIQIKSDGIFKEYWRRPGVKEKDMTSDGWLKTGDQAMVKAEHNNAAFILGRTSVDIIKSGGYKISALDIETAILHLPFVDEIAVVGVPDETWGEAVGAVCVAKPGKADELTLDNLRSSLRQSLAPYKLPQKLHVLDVMPRTPIGKIQKRPLRDRCFPAQRASKL